MRTLVGEREVKPNRSPLIDLINRNVGAPLGSPYCAGTVYYSFDNTDTYYPQQKSGLARSWVRKDSYTALDVLRGKYQIKAGDILIWQKNNSTQGHAGLANKDWQGISGETCEANTSSGLKGSQYDGDGIWIKHRKIEPYNYKFRIKWITRWNYTG